MQVASFVFWQITLLGILWSCLEVWTVYPGVAINTPSIYGFLLRILAGYLVLVYQTIYLHWAFMRWDWLPSLSGGWWWWRLW